MYEAMFINSTRQQNLQRLSRLLLVMIYNDGDHYHLNNKKTKLIWLGMEFNNFTVSHKISGDDFLSSLEVALAFGVGKIYLVTHKYYMPPHRKRKMLDIISFLFTNCDT